MIGPGADLIAYRRETNFSTKIISKYPTILLVDG
jgi:hypothetical protein